MRKKSLFFILITMLLAVANFKLGTLLSGSVLCANDFFYNKYNTLQKAKVSGHIQTNCLTAGQVQSNQPNISRISRFTTYFDLAVTNRVHNISVATEKLNNLSVASGGKLSFNTVVGARTAENGFKTANIIVGGKYVEGYGGGVCQVSSTLYNAWALAGLEVEKVQGHSLPSNYIELSRDATVSSEIDLILVNSSANAVEITAEVIENSVVIAIYGVKGKYEYRIYSETLQVIQPKILPDIEVEVDDVGDNEYEVNIGACGYLTRALIEVSMRGRIVTRRELRRDYYRPVDIQRIHKVKTPLS